jgi:hypothetical protein
VKYSDRLEELKTKRIELEANREVVVRRMQQLHAQITVRRKEGEIKLLFSTLNIFVLFLERDLWKQKYLMEKKKTTALEERTRMASVQVQI